MPVLRCNRNDCSGSWLCEKADVLRRRRMVFSSDRCPFLLAQGSPLGLTDREVQKSRKFSGSYTSSARLTSCLLCYYVSSRG